MELEWSSTKVGGLMSAAINMTCNLVDARSDRKVVEARRNEALTAVYDIGEKLDIDELREAMEAFDKLEERLEEVVNEVAMRTRVLKKVIRDACFVMTADDFRMLLKDETAGTILKMMPMFPTGALFEVTHYLSLESIVYHAKNHWEGSGCVYRMDGEMSLDACSVRIAGTPRALLTWVVKEFGKDSPVLENFVKCEDLDLINLYIQKHSEKGKKDEH